MSARAKPFDFPDFRARTESATPAGSPPIAPPAADLADVRAEGVIEGRRLAMETIAADEAAALARIAETLADMQAVLADRRARDQAEILGVAAVFLETFASGLAEKRELDAAIDLLTRLTAQSDDRRPARLVIARSSRERLGPKIETVLKTRKLEDFVAIDADPSLGAGEMRLEWRGGEARRTRREIVEATAALLQPLRARKEFPR